MSDERRIIKTLKLISRFDKINSSRLGVEEYPYWEFVPVDHNV